MPVELLGSGVAAVVIDQLSKRLVMQRLAGRSLSVGALVRIRPVANVSGGLMRNRSALMALWGMAVLSVVGLTWCGLFFRSGIARVALGVALGGATGNLIDRLRYGSVIDFIDLRFWPVFNLADVAIVVGLLAAFWFR